MLTVLLTDAAFTGLIRTLREAYRNEVRIIGLSTDDLTAHKAMLDAFYVVPSHKDSQYIDIVTDIARKEKVNVIFPIVTDALEQMAEAAAEIEAKSGAVVMTSSVGSIQIANDKGILYEKLLASADEDLRSLVPMFFAVTTKSELFLAIDRIRERGLTACIKPRRGEDATGFFVIDDTVKDSDVIFGGAAARRLTLSLLKKYLEDLAPDAKIPASLVCEYLPGEEWDVDCIMRDQKWIGATTRVNLSMFGGLTAVLETRRNPLLSDYARKIAEHIGLSFVFCISFKERADHSFALLEINPRMMGNIYVSALAGNNYVRMAVDLMNGKQVDFREPIEGIRTSLYYDQTRIDTLEQEESRKI